MSPKSPSPKSGQKGFWKFGRKREAKKSRSQSVREFDGKRTLHVCSMPTEAPTQNTQPVTACLGCRDGLNVFINSVAPNREVLLPILIW